MSTLHDQAMSNVYAQVFKRLLEHFSQSQRASLQLLIQRLLVAAGGMQQVGDFKLMMAHGGGKDSAFALACLRAAQLSIAARGAATFELRVVTARHLGLSTAVIDNIERSYSALVLHDDPRVQLLTLDGGEMRPFDARRPVSARQQQTERFDTLLTGHLTGGQVRPMFCNRFYLELADLYRQSMSWHGGVDVLISADPLPERKRYLAWGRRMMREAGLAFTRPVEAHPGTLLQGLGQLRHTYLNHVLGQPDTPAWGLPGPEHTPRFMDIADLLHDYVQEQDTVLAFLGFHYDELSLGFSQSANANPLLMAHLGGLRAQFVEGRDYAHGVEAYLQQAKVQMQRKHMPAARQALALVPWRDPAGQQRRRALANDFAQEAYGLSEAQLVCLLFTPFVDQGRGLKHYLSRCHPGMLMALSTLHDALQGQPSAEPLVHWLEEVSGLSLATLRMLYRREREAPRGGRSLLARARDSDPGRLRH